MKHIDRARIAKPNIAEVLEEFLDDQHKRLAAKTFSQYEGVIELLEYSLNGYAYPLLNDSDMKFFDRLLKAKGENHREFCEIFGPEYIIPHFDEFLSYFLACKEMASDYLLRTAGTVTRKLGKWLIDKGYAKQDDMEYIS